MDPKLGKKTLRKLAREKQLMQLRKDTLIREEGLDKISLDKIKEKWYNNLLNIKIPEIQDNLRYILHYMEKLVEDDSFKKLLFENERQELDDKSVLQAQSHSSALDMLYGIYQNRIQDLQDTYSETVSQKMKQSSEEFKLIENRENTIQENMQTMLYQMQYNREKKEDTMNCDMFLKLDDERSRSTEKYENLKAKLEKKMEKRWGEITSTLLEYDKSTQQRKKYYAELKAKDDADSKIIYQQMNKTQKLLEQLEELKNCYDECYAPKEMLLLITDLRDEKEKFFDAFNTLKVMLAEELKSDEIHLKNLTITSNRIVENLKSLCIKGEQILTLFRICRKMETEEEKVIIVGSNLNLLKQTANTRESRKAPEETIISYHEPGNWTKEYEILDQFWKKVGNIQLSKLALIKCIHNLEKKNLILRKSLVFYVRHASKNMIC